MVTFYGDAGAEMVRIEKGGETVFEGNYWDLPQDPKGLCNLLLKLGLEADFKTYIYED